GASSTWTYWSIVLEETSNKIYIVDQRHSAMLTGLTVGIQINNTTAIGVNNGAPSVATIAGADPSQDDNAYYEFIPGNRPQYDLMASAFPIPQYVSLATAPVNITGTITNVGSATVTNYTINYSINGAAPITSNVTSVNVATFGTHTFSHSVPWTPASTGSYIVKIWATNINGNPDMNTANDAITKNVFVATSLAQRKALYEQLTSSTCGPCASSDPALSVFLNDNGTNTPSGKVVAIKYHMNYPSPGTDPAYMQESSDRHSYYGVTGIPRAIIGGTSYNGHPASIVQADIDKEYNKPAIFEIGFTETVYLGKKVTIKGTIKALADVPAGLRLHAVIVENQIDKSATDFIGTTSQNIFKYVMRRMLAGSNGEALGAFTSGQITNFEFTHDFTSSPKIFSSIEDLSVVAFIQDQNTKEAFQAEHANIIDATTNIEMHEMFGNVNIYPNPFRNTTNISFGLKETNDVKVKIYNAMGQIVFAENKGILTEGSHTITLNVNNLSSGIYFVNLTVGEHQIMKKISIVE
nr:T9SS type A sorting domain-containing protein [Bacteroidota bacterium]